MSSFESQDDILSVSIVIPAYNSAEWLPSTLASLSEALLRTPWRAEVIVVDDGSTDKTVDVLSLMQNSYPYPIRILEQSNQGVFLAIWEGLRIAEFGQLLILNSRLLLREDALEYLSAAILENPETRSWNGHVATDGSAPLVGRFWEVPTYVFWGSYLAHPLPTLITSENFDRVPKGTGCFLVEKKLFRQAYEVSWPKENARFTSDDTKLLRYIAGVSPIRLDPGFFATYRPRTTFMKFLAHSRGRGTMFVDSYGGTSMVRNIILVLLGILPPLLIAALIALAVTSQWLAFAITITLIVVALLIPAVIATARHAPSKGVLSYLAFVIPFGATFWSGLVRGLIIHRKSLTRNTRPREGGTP